MILGKLLPTGASNLYSGKFILIKNTFENLKMSSDYGSNWSDITSQSFSTPELRADLSSDGKYITIGEKTNSGKLYVSSDGGASFTLKHTCSSSQQFRGVSMSETGQYQLAVIVGGAKLVSSDYGQTWSSIGTNKTHQDCYVSSSGQYMITSELFGLLNLSTNYGSSFSAITSGNQSWYSSCISDNGQYILGAINNGYMYISTDGGTNFTSITSTGTRYWKKVRISESGQYQLAILENTLQWYKSSDYGQTWSLGTTSSSWYDCSMDKTGQTQYLGSVSNNIRVYKSSNSGSSFSPMLNTSLGIWYLTQVCK